MCVCLCVRRSVVYARITRAEIPSHPRDTPVVLADARPLPFVRVNALFGRLPPRRRSSVAWGGTPCFKIAAFGAATKESLECEKCARKRSAGAPGWMTWSCTIVNGACSRSTGLNVLSAVRFTLPSGYWTRYISAGGNASVAAPPILQPDRCDERCALLKLRRRHGIYSQAPKLQRQGYALQSAVSAMPFRFKAAAVSLENRAVMGW